MPDLFALREEPKVPPRIAHRLAPTFSTYESDEVPQYRLIEDDDTVKVLRDKNREDSPAPFRHLSADELEDALGTASDAVDAIEAGEYDTVLDMLLFAEEHEFGNRSTVVDAIAARHREIVEQQKASTSETLRPSEVKPA